MRLGALRPRALYWLGAVSILVIVCGACLIWSAKLNNLVDRTIAAFRSPNGKLDKDGTGEREHNHGDHGHVHGKGRSDDAPNYLELSPQARQNLGLTTDHLETIRLKSFWRSISVPGEIVERPGRTTLKVATPMTGVVTHVHALPGEAIDKGTLLFQIRLTHEDLVQAQTEFLKTLGELEVERREVVRLQAATSTGAVARVRLLERQYSQEKLEALLSAQREALRLHGLSASQVDQIAEEKRLLRELQVVVPTPDRHDHDELRFSVWPAGFVEDDTGERPIHHHPVGERAIHSEGVTPVPDVEGGARSTSQHEPHPSVANSVTETSPLILSELLVHKGQAVEAGTTLCVLSDLSQLYVQGLAYEKEVRYLEDAIGNDWELSVSVPETLLDVQAKLDFEFIENRVDSQTRARKFYAVMANEIVRTWENERSQRFVQWRYSPGQRVQLEIPVEEWEKQIVLPLRAVAREGAENYVFRKNGARFERNAVHVVYRDQNHVVIANDGALPLGAIVATQGAHQMQIALRNQSAPPVDPHAGHSH